MALALEWVSVAKELALFIGGLVLLILGLLGMVAVTAVAYMARDREPLKTLPVFIALTVAGIALMLLA